MKKFYVPRKNKTFYKWLLSYMVVLLIPIIIIGYIYYTKTVFVIDRHTEEKFETMAKRASQEIDKKFEEIREINIRISMAPWAEKLMGYEHNIYKSVDIIMVEDIMRELNNYISLNGIIEDIALIFPKSDFIISTHGRDTTESFYTHNAFGNALSAKINKAAGEYTFYRIFQAENVQTLSTVFNPDARVIPIVQSMDSTSKIPCASLLVLVNENLLKSMINKNVFNDQCKFSLVWDNGYTIGDIDTNEFSNSEIKKNPADMNIEPMWYGDNCVYAIRSKLAPWTYVYQVPKSVMLYDGKNISMYIIVSTVLIFIIGFLISAFFTVRNYNPLHRLFVVVKNQIDTSKDREKTSEFKIIEESVDRICMENKLSRKKLITYEPVIRANRLMQLAKGYFTSDQNALKILMEVGLKTYGDISYTAVVVEVLKNDNEKQVDGYSVNTYEKLRIINILEKWFEEKGFNAQVFESDKERITSILTLNSDDVSIMDITSEMRKFVKDKTEDEIYAGFGDLVKRPSDIGKSFEKAVKMLDWIVFTGDDSDINMESYMEADNSFYFYPADWEVHIVNSLKAGNLEAARQVIKDIKYENCVNRKLAFSVLRRLLFALVETLMKAMDELNITDIRYEAEFERVISCRKESGMWKYIDQKCSDICEKVKNIKMHSNSLLKERIVKYVSDNCFDSSMSLKELSEKFDMPSSSLSKIFKEVAGVNFLEYVNRKRVEKAKDYLRETNKRICSISGMVGYENDKSFRRIFKRYEGVSPVEYRSFIINR